MLRAEVIRPSELSAGDVATWHQMLEASPLLQRAFFTPEFALACERATGRARVAVLHANSTICAFMPFQFRDVWCQRLHSAERIGGGLSDNAGIIAGPDFRTNTNTLLRLCRLASLNISHIMEGQDRFGLQADWSDYSYVTALDDGPDAYFSMLLARDRDFVRDTERSERRAGKTLGQLQLVETSEVSAEAVGALVAMKRLQYQRTQVRDAFDVPGNLSIIEQLRGSPAPGCQLVLVRLIAGKQLLAQHLGLRYHNVLSWWFPVYDIAVRNLSPGRLLLWHVIRHATDSGLALIDYGAGEALYKQQFSTGRLRMGRAVWSAETMRSYLAQAWQSLEWRLDARRRAKGNAH